jgi:hypothetical protein
VIYYRMLHVILISADTIARSFRFGPESTRGPIVATRHSSNVIGKLSSGEVALLLKYLKFVREQLALEKTSSAT